MYMYTHVFTLLLGVCLQVTWTISYQCCSCDNACIGWNLDFSNEIWIVASEDLIRDSLFVWQCMALQVGPIWPGYRSAGLLIEDCERVSKDVAYMRARVSACSCMKIVESCVPQRICRHAPKKYHLDKKVPPSACHSVYAGTRLKSTT